jgi:drug/metabolite transporter (DMT)-like permease
MEIIMNTTVMPARAALSRHLAIVQPEARGIALGLFAAAIWGAYLALAKAGVSAGLAPGDIAFIRYGVAGLVMLPWLLAHGLRDCGGVGWRRASVLALLVGPLFILIGVGGYRFAPLAHGAVMQPAALTILGIVLAAVIFRDRPGFGRLLGVAIMIAGLAVIAGPGLLKGGSWTPLGDAMFIGAGAMWAVFTVLTKLWKVAPLPATAAVSVLSAAIFVPCYLATEGVGRLLALAPSMLLAQVLVQGVLSGVVAVIAYTRAAALLGPARAAVFPAMVPAVAILLGIPLAGEWPTLLQMAGLALVSAGLLVAIGVVKALR